MSAPMKKHLTEVRVDDRSFFVNPSVRPAVILYLRALKAKEGGCENQGWLSPRELRKEFLDGLPSYALNLKAARRRSNMTQVKLARLTGIDRSNLNAYENAKKKIGPKTALTLSRVLNIDPRILN